jgi:diaminohydroxyphosphoribosylaminopyrimidine deaminase/5-amino-6-(5-phosphoribosylamino)uracil reductase
MIDEHDISLLHQATRLAVRGHGAVEPNPLVGCVITSKEGTLIGEGFHEKFGEAHAEINALAEAGEGARNGTAYITLEPCNHQGKTPPCSQALIQAGIARVVIGTKDPHDTASGGADFLRREGVDVDIINDELCLELIRPFTHRIKTGLPWVTCKWAQTIDGCIETPENVSQWISCKESLQLVHEERGCVDAIMVGIGTVVHDNPSLTVRNTPKHRTPLRVVIDPNLRTPSTSKILNNEAPTLLVHAEGVDTSSFKHCQLFALPWREGALDFIPLLRLLVNEYDATNVIAEGGATLFQHIFNQNLANELWIFVSPQKSKITPAINMNTLVDSLTTSVLDEQPSGTDTVRRLAVHAHQI